MEQSEDRLLYELFEKVIRIHHCKMVGLFEKLGLFYGQPPILFDLDDKDGQTQTELCRKRILTPATMTATLKRMEKSGLVLRRSDSEDSRITRVFITDKSRALLQEARIRLEQFQAETFAGFTSVEKVLLRRFLAQIENNLNLSENPKK